MFTRIEEFRESVIHMRSKIDGVIVEVGARTDEVGRINDLASLQRNARNAQSRLSLIPSLPAAESHEKYIEWIAHVRQFRKDIALHTGMGELLQIPDSIPTGRYRLRKLCSEIEQQRVRQIAVFTRQIGAWNEEGLRLQRLRESTENRVRIFIGELQSLLNALPVQPHQLRDVRSEIEGLGLLTAARRSLPLGMGPSYADLQTLKSRLDEILAYLLEVEEKIGKKQPAVPETVKPSPAAIIGAWCKSRRESLRDLAGKAGISPNTLRKIMLGRSVRSGKIAAVADVLGCRYEHLLPG